MKAAKLKGFYPPVGARLGSGVVAFGEKMGASWGDVSQPVNAGRRPSADSVVGHAADRLRVG